MNARAASRWAGGDPVALRAARPGDRSRASSRGSRCGGCPSGPARSRSGRWPGSRRPTAMSYFDGPKRTMSVMNVPVEASNFGTPFSIVLDEGLVLGLEQVADREPRASCRSTRASSSKQRLQPGVRLRRIGVAELDEAPLGLAPDGRPALRSTTTALWIAFHETCPPAALSSACARSSQITNTSGVITSGCGASSPLSRRARCGSWSASRRRAG